MKKFLISSMVFIVCFISSFAQAYEKGAGFYVEYGRDLYKYTSYTEIEIHYRFKFWNIELKPYGITKTWFLVEKSDEIGAFRGNPFCDIYTVGTEIKYEGLSFFYEHNCAHRVYSQNDMWQTEEYKISGNSDIIGVRYQFN